MSTITFTIAGSAVSVAYGSWNLTGQIDQQDSCSFTVVDTTGTANFQKRQTVEISDSVRGIFWTGYINKAKATKMVPNTGRLWTIDCIDQTYLPSKRTSNKVYANQYSGTIVADQVQRYLADEGVTGDFALDWDELEADFAAGTLTNVVATTNSHDGNNGDGDLELALAGSDVTWSDGDLSSGGISTLKLVGTAFQGVNNNYIYQKIWEGSITIQAGDHLDYWLWIVGSSPQIMAGVDFVCTDGTSFRDSAGAGTDAQGVLPHPKYDLSGLADDQWYFRSFGVSSPLIGKTLQYISVAFEGDNAGTYTAFFKEIYYYKTGGTVQQIIFDHTMTAPALNNLISVNGYQNVSLTVVDSYVNVIQNVTTHSIDGAKIAKGSYIDWVTGPLGNASVDPKAMQLVETSIDNGATWQTATLNQPIPNLTPGMKVASRNLQYRISLLLGTDPSLASFLGVSGKVYSSYNATKSDVVTTYTSQSDFNTGTYTDTMSPSGGHLTSNGFARNWDDAFYGNQTTFGSSGQFVGIYIRQQLLKADAGADSRTRIDFAGNRWGNFTAEVDVKVTVNGNLGIEYFTTTWNNTLNSYAYNAFVTPTQVCLAKGGNGSNSFANVVTPVTVSFTDGSWHRLKVVVTGSVHDVFVDGIRYIHATDSTYGGPGYVALRFFNSSGTNGQSGFFDNFGIVSALTGTWQSPSIDISGATTYGSSMVEWDSTQIPNTTSVTAQTSIDGGSTWLSVTNGGAISGLTAGGSLSGKHLLIKMTLTASNASVLPVLSGITAWVMGQFNATGNRISPALSLAAVGRAGASLVNWNALLPTNTSIAVATSLDAGASYQSVAAAGNAISGITVQPAPWVDSFDSNTSSSYTQGQLVGSSSGGGTWTWDTANSRLTVAGSNADALYYNGATFVDGFIEADLTKAQHNGGMLLRAQTGSGNAYIVFIGDSVGGNYYDVGKYIASTYTSFHRATLTFVQGTPHRFRLTVAGTSISFSIDGTTLFTTTDASITAAGKAGVLGGWGGDNEIYTALRIQPYGQLLGSYQATILADSPLRYYRLDESSGTVAHDSGSQAQNGTITGGVTLAQPGLIAGDADTAMNFNGSSGYITAASTGLPTGANPWSAECWVKPSGTGHAAAIIYFGGSSAGLYLLMDSSNRLKVYIGATGTIDGGINLSVGHIYYLCVAYNGSNLVLTVGDLSGGTFTTTTLATGATAAFVADSLYIGNDLFAEFFLGTIDEPAIYSTALSASQVAAHYTAGVGILTKVILTSTDPTTTPAVLDIQTFVAGPTMGTGTLIPSANYQNTFVSSNIDDQKTQSNYWWLIDQNKKIQFQAQNAQPAPWIIASANASTQIGSQTIGDVLVDNLTLENSGDLYRNRQILTGVQDTAIFSKNFNGDGSSTSWTLDYPIADGTVPTITLNGQFQSVGVQGVDVGKQFYYQVGSTSITADGSVATLLDSDVLSVSYTGAFTTSITLDNTGSSYPGTANQAAMAAIDGSSGIVEDVTDVSSLNLNVAAATTYGQQLLQRYGVIGQTLTFKTLRQGLAPGQQLTVFVPEQGVNDVPFLVQSVETTAQQGQDANGNPSIVYWYAVTALTGPNLGSWVKLFASGLKG